VGTENVRQEWGWLRALRHEQRAERALVRQLANQERKAHTIAGREDDVMTRRRQHARRVRAVLESLYPIPQEARILEVGSGAHGLIFFWDAPRAVGVDPLALQYAALFPAWQDRAATATAFGEALPFPDGAFDVVLTDNVVDHADRPEIIMAEIARVLKPQGVLYFSVNVHHPAYALTSVLHGWWNALGLPLEITPFADHTFHLTLDRARQLFAGLPLRVLYERAFLEQAKEHARHASPRSPGDLLKRFLWKNALFEVVAVREDA
jgi:SAM-dependent methyltransferase